MWQELPQAEQIQERNYSLLTQEVSVGGDRKTVNKHTSN